MNKKGIEALTACIGTVITPSLTKLFDRTFVLQLVYDSKNVEEKASGLSKT